ncbi:MAG: phytanoyl-CoA dioxygenase family protein [candidate division Zixibacteria bacterium]|nr:phytanoyl-CoA dioxygenase family protein [candidate division Zixibacteria bacterium]
MSSYLPLFRLTEPSREHIDDFHRDGYIAFPDIFTDEGREELIAEALRYTPVREFLARSPEERQKHCNPFIYFERPWNDREVWADSLIDAPLITALLRATIGPDYHFCHSALNVALPGVGPIGFHQDHHHWFHQNPVNLAERENAYIQVLYYPNGFKRGDRSLSVIPGSHRVSPLPEVTPERLLAGDFDQQAGRELRKTQLELPPGSMVYLNARMFHAVEPKPLDSTQPFRLFVIDIFKQAGPPHRYTQEITDAWLERATSYRRNLFDRAAYTPECWIP